MTVSELLFKPVFIWLSECITCLRYYSGLHVDKLNHFTTTVSFCPGWWGCPDRNSIRGEQITDLDSAEAGATWHGSVQGGAAHLHPGAKVLSGQTVWLLLPRRLPVRVSPSHLLFILRFKGIVRILGMWSFGFFTRVRWEGWWWLSLLWIWRLSQNRMEVKEESACPAPSIFCFLFFSF